jgi:exosortase
MASPVSEAPTVPRTRNSATGASELVATLMRDKSAVTVASITGVLFLVLFYRPLAMLLWDWWNVPEAGHGLLLAPVALWYAWKEGIDPAAQPNRALGLGLLAAGVMVRFASGLAAEFFTMRGSMVLSLVALVVYFVGTRQVLRWWLPFVLIALSIPLPELVTQALALPLQFQASRMGAALLEARQIPVLLTGNVIRLPGHELFVTEACSGLRSLTALVSTAVLMAALLFRTPFARVLLVLVAIPIAVLINGVRVFLTGFLVYYVSPKIGTGFMHATEGWLLFLVSLGLMGLFAWGISLVERRFANTEVSDAA